MRVGLWEADRRTVRAVMAKDPCLAAVEVVGARLIEGAAVCLAADLEYRVCSMKKDVSAAVAEAVQGSTTAVVCFAGSVESLAAASW